MVGSGEEPASWMFSVPAHDGGIGKHGAFGYVQGGTPYGSASATFRANGSC
jgi:hypothetical protein